MDIKLFFDPVGFYNDFESNLDTDQLGKQIKINQDGSAIFANIDIVIFSIADEYTSLRKTLYQLKKGEKNYKVLDLGVLRPGESLHDTSDRLAAVIEFIINKKKTPLVIGDSHAYSFGQFKGYENQSRGIKISNIDSIMDVDEGEVLNQSNHLFKIITHQPGYLRVFSQIAFQQYLNAPSVVNVFEKLAFGKYRLGELREDITQIEPVLRMSDMVSFDMAALSGTVFQSKADQNPFGLQLEEACQLAWYAGHSDQLSSMSFLGYKEVESQSDHMVLATMLWYFIEGYYHKIKDEDFEGSGYTKYAVMVEQENVTLDFYKHNISGKWWMKDANDFTVACSYDDYDLACKGELPPRWLKPN